MNLMHTIEYMYMYVEKVFTIGKFMADVFYMLCVHWYIFSIPELKWVTVAFHSAEYEYGYVYAYD